MAHWGTAHNGPGGHKGTGGPTRAQGGPQGRGAHESQGGPKRCQEGPRGPREAYKGPGRLTRAHRGLTRAQEGPQGPREAHKRPRVTGSHQGPLGGPQGLCGQDPVFINYLNKRNEKRSYLYILVHNDMHAYVCICIHMYIYVFYIFHVYIYMCFC